MCRREPFESSHKCHIVLLYYWISLNGYHVLCYSYATYHFSDKSVQFMWYSLCSRDNLIVWKKSRLNHTWYLFKKNKNLRNYFLQLQTSTWITYRFNWSRSNLEEASHFVTRQRFRLHWLKHWRKVLSFSSDWFSGEKKYRKSKKLNNNLMMKVSPPQRWVLLLGNRNLDNHLRKQYLVESAMNR